ncbi:hypothetical protein PRIC2_000784 [Phytophthora ramorum]
MTRAAPDEAPFSRKRKADDFEWETSKENVVPLKRGRNVADLNMALRAHESFQTKLRLEDEVKAKEDALAVYSGDDPLAGWIDYVRWLEVKMPEDTRKKFKVLEKCTRELKDEPKYRNDMRYVRLWIQYADLVSNPKDIFKYLYQNKIGERVSLFYIGWAYVLETMANYPQAHKIYLKASQKKAEPQDLLERKYKEFQRRMSRQWLRMTEEIGANDIDEVTHRRALESLSAYGTLELNDAQREQLHQHQASARAQRVQHANAHKPVFIIYEDPVGHSVDPFDGNGGWKKLGSMQQQDKENELAPSTWNPPAPRGILDASRQPGSQSVPVFSGQSDASPLQVFVDDEFSLPEHETKRPTPLTHRSQTLRQRMEGVATEEEMLAQEPLKNFTASDKKARMQKQGTKGRAEKICYDVKQLTSDTGEAVSFEEVRAQAFKQAVDRRRELDSRALQSVSISMNSVSNATSPAALPSATHEEKPVERKPTTFPVTSRPVGPSKPASTHHDANEDMTINTRVALEDINNMFCSPPRQPKPSVWEVKEDAPVERKLHFSVFDDSVDSVAVNAQDQSLRQDPNESIPKQTFQIFSDDGPEEHQAEKMTWSQKRKPLGARDDLNGALLVMDKGYLGTLFDVLNCYKQAGVTFPEVLAVYYGIKMLRCIELLHKAQVLHGDIKPDNWLMAPGNPSSELVINHQDPHNDKDFQAGGLYLIDYGRSIDLTLYPEMTTFRGNCHVKGFQCVEMLTQRPWTKQIDTFAFCGTMHCMLFGEYMEVKSCRNSKGMTHWGIVKPFQRYWQVDMWKDVFHALLNVTSCWEQPSLPDLRRRLENYFASDPSRQQELFKHLSRQDRFLRKSTV